MTWHVDPSQDLESRRQMMGLIASFLTHRTGREITTAPASEDLITAARKIEVQLYKASKSKMEYMETVSLGWRIRELEGTNNVASISPASRPMAQLATAIPTMVAVLSASLLPPMMTMAAAAVPPVASMVPAPRPAASPPAAVAPPASSASVPPVSVAPIATNPAPSPPTATSSQIHDDIVRQRQTRLLRLRHASKCNLPPGQTCKEPNCLEMKALWRHISDCKMPECLVPHCVSSRFVLAHFYRCKDKACKVCTPVRIVSAESHRQQALLDAQKQQQQQQPKSLSRQNSNAVAAAAASSSFTQQRGDFNPNETALEHNRRLAKSVPKKSQDEKVIIDPKFARGAKDGTGPSLPLSMDNETIKQHLAALKVEHNQQLLLPVLRKVMEHKANGSVFNEPVNTDVLLDYASVIKTPMDFGTIRHRLEDGRYEALRAFEDDVRLVFTNATSYNPPENGVHQNANILRQVFETEMKKVHKAALNPSFARDDPTSVKMSKSGVKGEGPKCPMCSETTCERCVLCDRGCVPYEQRALYCFGPCQQKIQRNREFYYQVVGSGTSLNWCIDCYEKKYPGDYVVDTSTQISYPKQFLIKRKHDETIEEPWVACDNCQRWCHQACALFNPRKQNPKNKDLKYLCPKCLVDPKVKRTRDVHVPDAADLEKTKLGTFLEEWVRRKLIGVLATDKTVSANVPPADAISIRILSNADEMATIKPAAVSQLNLPKTVGYRSRSIFLYQKLDGVDVLLFVMYVQEYGSDAPPQNRGKLYIAYLDSVHYFRPRKYRTLVYHELLLAYLEYSRRKGFAACYIWACPPPTKKDDYILHSHPEDQRVPSHEHLRLWYHNMIKRGASDRIVLSSCTLYEEHFETNPSKKSSGSGGSSSNKKKDGKRAGAAAPTKKGKAAYSIAVGGSSMSSVVSGGGVSGASLLHRSTSTNIGPAMTVGGDLPMDATASGRSAAHTPELLEDEDDEEVMNDIDLADKLEDLNSDNPLSSSSFAPSDDIRPLSYGLRVNDYTSLVPDESEQRRRVKSALEFQMPYFDGDYWPTELDDVLREMAMKIINPRADAKSKKALPADAEAEKQNQLIMADPKQVSAKAAMARIGEALEGMKGDFLVVKLAHECSKCGVYLMGARWECRHPECMAAGFSRPSPFALCEGCFAKDVCKPSEAQHGKRVQLGKPRGGDVVKAAAAASVSTTDMVPVVAANGASAALGALVPTSAPFVGLPTSSQHAEWKNQKLGCIRKSFAPLVDHQLVFVDEEIPLKIQHSDRVYKNPFLETRHAFLSLCTGNRYTFNFLRRAKHSTMMVLYHLHNPEAPAHLYTCNSCRIDILSGKRYNCAWCLGGDFDLCQECLPKHVDHLHKLTPSEVTRGVDQDAAESKRNKTKLEKRRARDRTLALFLNGLVHASSCHDPDCIDATCIKLKGLLKHRLECKVRVRGGCETCRRVLGLAQMHSRICPLSLNCPVTHCRELKHHLATHGQVGSNTQVVGGGAGVAAGGAASSVPLVIADAKRKNPSASVEPPKSNGSDGGSMKVVIKVPQPSPSMTSPSPAGNPSIIGEPLKSNKRVRVSKSSPSPPPPPSSDRTMA